MRHDITFENGGAELIYEIISLQNLGLNIEALEKAYKETRLAGMQMAIVLLQGQFNAQYVVRHEAMQKFCRKNDIDFRCQVEVNADFKRGEYFIETKPYEPEQEDLI